jgi:hypothetical protein
MRPNDNGLRGPRRLACGLLTVLAISLTGCASTRPAASDLAAAGKKTTEVAAAYYAELDNTARQKFEQESLNEAFSAIRNDCVKRLKAAPTSDTCIAGMEPTAGEIRENAVRQVSLYSKILAATAARRQMAARIGALYDDLGELAEKDLGASFAAQGKGLAESVEKIKGTPLAEAQGELLNKALGSLGTSVQNTELRAGAGAIDPVIGAYREFFVAEKVAWDTFSDQAIQLRQQNVIYAVQLGFGDTEDAAKRLLHSIGLETGSAKLTRNPATFEAVALDAALGAGAADSALKSAGSAVLNALKALEKAHAEFNAPAAGPAAAEQFATEAAAYLELITKLRNDDEKSK